jgi:uncharacterized membrane protein (UPF0127 family)
VKSAAWSFLVLALASCTSEGKPPPAHPAPVAAAPAVRFPSGDPAAESYPMPALPLAKVTLVDGFKATHLVEAEVAASGIARTRGLMWRTQLAAGKGMLFIFTAEQPLSFWMRNTLIPLDMIFINKDLKITGIVENAEPKTLTSRGVGIPSLYVLEVPGGWCKQAGVTVGSEVKLDGVVGVEVTP